MDSKYPPRRRGLPKQFPSSEPYQPLKKRTRAEARTCNYKEFLETMKEAFELTGPAIGEHFASKMKEKIEEATDSDVIDFGTIGLAVSFMVKHIIEYRFLLVDEDGSLELSKLLSLVYKITPTDCEEVFEETLKQLKEYREVTNNLEYYVPTSKVLEIVKFVLDGCRKMSENDFASNDFGSAARTLQNKYNPMTFNGYEISCCFGDPVVDIQMGRMIEEMMKKYLEEAAEWEHKPNSESAEQACRSPIEAVPAKRPRLENQSVEPNPQSARFFHDISLKLDSISSQAKQYQETESSINYKSFLDELSLGISLIESELLDDICLTIQTRTDKADDTDIIRLKVINKALSFGFSAMCGAKTKEELDSDALQLPKVIECFSHIIPEGHDEIFGSIRAKVANFEEPHYTSNYKIPEYTGLEIMETMVLMCQPETE